MYYKETPKHVIRSENGEITYLVEWYCPKCDGNGCKICKHKGVLDGPAMAYYNEVTRWQK